MNNVLITGASGLAGREISEYLKKNGYNVWGTYKTNKIKNIDIDWIKADFSDLKKTRKFLYEYKDILKDIDYLIHTYGPIIFKRTEELQSEDFIKDFFDNTIVSYEILSFLLNNSNLKKAIFFGFHELGNHKPYKMILSYSIAKNSLFDLLVSLRDIYKKADFKILSFTQIKGAEYEINSLNSIDSKSISNVVFDILNTNKYESALIVEIK